LPITPSFISQNSKHIPGQEQRLHEREENAGVILPPKNFENAVKEERSHHYGACPSRQSAYNEVNRNLNVLEREGIVTQQHIGHKRIIRLNLKNQKTSALLKALRILEHANNSLANQFNFNGEFQFSLL
jgi:hypothetical protein